MRGRKLRVLPDGPVTYRAGRRKTPRGVSLYTRWPRHMKGVIHVESKHQTRIRPKVYTVAEFAQAFVISPRRVRDLIRKGEIPALRIGRSYRIPRKAAAEYLARALPPTVRTGNRSKTSLFDNQTGYLFPSPTMH